ncbi:MAG TPA: acetyl-CoA carboxylase biotin carboxylase subunit [Nitriliruptoraceae bacterium]|nr:acetyl-CoA carboxylase biotin carboxylase subunit [Nitriliruptoraceae bacterium]
MFDAVLIANRGEIAIRVIRACHELGVRTVAVHSEVDADAPHVQAADESHLLGPAPAAQSYLRSDRILEVAALAGVDAIHPGYGFLAENADFARAVADAGFVFVGPPPTAIARMGDKLSARAVAEAAGVAVVPGTSEPTDDVAEAIAFGTEHGWPVAVKAMFGGGGRGMKVVKSPDAMRAAMDAARREAQAAFGRDECYLERYLERPRHVEVQVLADLDGTTIHLGTRDCSLQRRHQKLVEEAPAPNLAEAVRNGMAVAAIDIAREMGYTNAGTCEFLVDDDTSYFLEMNTRLQVEHPVTELVTGIDLVHAQLRIAAGDGMGISQDDVHIRGHAIEARINAEDPANSFMPTPGRITRLTAPDGPWVRFDTGAASGWEVPRTYDSLVGKLVVWGPDRAIARSRMARALEELVIAGIPTTVPFHKLAMAAEQFATATHSTVSVEQEWDLSAIPAHVADDPPDDANPSGGASMPSNPGRTTSARDVQLTIGGAPFWVTVHGHGGDRAGDSSRTRRADDDHGAADGTRPDDPVVRAPMQATIIGWEVAEGDTVAVGDTLVVVEAMKMETPVVAHRDGIVAGVHLEAGASVAQGDALATIGTTE